MTEFDLGNCHVDLTRQRIVRGEQSWGLTAMERRLLEYMARRGNETVSREELLSEVWEYAASSNTHTVRTTINRLRAKIEVDPAQPAVLLTLRGQGYQLVVDALPEIEDAPTPRATNLGPAASSCVDRLELLGTLTEMVGEGGGVITLHGPGGAGKTTLANHFSRARVGDCPGGVWMCPLEDAHTLEDLCNVIHRSLGLPHSSEDRAREVSEALRASEQTLLILDNFEQLPQDCSLQVQQWWTEAPHTLFLVTSRHRLAVESERVLPVGALTPAQARELYLRRVREVSPDWPEMSDEREAALSALLAAVDHLPLAIELAAARASILPPEALLARLQSIDGLLSSRRQDRPERQQTLEATLALSWDLLTAHEQSALHQMHVFRGGFRLVDAEKVIQLADDAPWIGDLIQSLQEKSWVRVSESRHSMRFTLLAVIHRYISRQSQALSDRDAAIALSQRHARHYANLPPGADRASERDAQQRLHLHADIENIVHGLEASLEHAWAPEAAELALALAEVCRSTGIHAHHLERIRSARALEQLPEHAIELAIEEAVYSAAAGGAFESSHALLDKALSDARAHGSRSSEGHALRELGLLLYQHTTQPALPYLEESLTVHEQLEDAEQAGLDLNAISLVLARRGRHQEAVSAAERSIERQLQARLPLHEAQSRSTLATSLYRLGELTAAREQLESSLALFRSVGAVLPAAKVNGNLAFIELHAGELDRAIQRTTQNIAENRAVRNLRSEGTARSNLGMMLHQKGELARAQALYEEVLDIAQRLESPHMEARTLLQRAHLDQDAGRPEAASTGFTRSLTQFQSLGDVDGELRARAGLANHCAESDPDEAMRQLDIAIDLLSQAPSYGALLHTRLALLSAKAGDAARAGAHLDEAEEHPAAPLAWSHCEIQLLRAETQLLLGDHADARRLVESVGPRLSKMNLSPQSTLWVQRDRLRSLLDETNTPEGRDP